MAEHFAGGAVVPHRCIAVVRPVGTKVGDQGMGCPELCCAKVPTNWRVCRRASLNEELEAERANVEGTCFSQLRRAQ